METFRRLMFSSTTGSDDWIAALNIPPPDNCGCLKHPFLVVLSGDAEYLVRSPLLFLTPGKLSGRRQVFGIHAEIGVRQPQRRRRGHRCNILQVTLHSPFAVTSDLHGTHSIQFSLPLASPARLKSSSASIALPSFFRIVPR